jgi:tetratricopeptide (TPR) repeat protein
MGPVRATLDELQALRDHRDVALEAEYAHTCVQAAVAAAQDERPVMELLLTHARDLAERLQQRDRRANWPLPFNFVAGDLWFEVDRYDEARAAYERAVQSAPSALALVGLARTQSRLGRAEEACATYARVKDAAAGLRAAAAKDLSRCR